MHLFYFGTKINVCIGDCVNTGSGQFGTLLKILEPGSIDAIEFSCESGGVLIEEDWNGVKSLKAINITTDAGWEDVVFINRFQK